MTPLRIGPSSLPTLLALGAVVLGLLFLGIGVTLLRQQGLRRRTWVRLRGEAYDYVWSGGDNSLQTWKLRWSGPDGAEHRCQNPYGVSGGTLRTFPFPVDLLVDPADPDKAQVASGVQNGLLIAVIFTVLGAGLLIVGAGVALALAR